MIMEEGLALREVGTTVFICSFKQYSAPTWLLLLQSRCEWVDVHGLVPCEQESTEFKTLTISLELV